MHTHRLFVAASSLAVLLTMAFPALAQVVTSGGEVTGIAPKKIVDRTLPLLESHLARARAVAAQL